MPETDTPATDVPRIAGLTLPWAIGAFVVDVLLVLVFATLGKQAHEAGSSAEIVLRIAWPYLVGLVVAWVVLHVRRWVAYRAWPAGVTVWLVTYVVGMALRGISGRGLAPAFLVVAIVFLGLVLVGWRGFAAAKLHYRGRRAGATD